MFYKGKRVLVTGGSGFVGTHVVEELLKQEARVRIPLHQRSPVLQDGRIELVNADLTKREDCERVSEGVDYIIHAAGPVGAAGVSPADQMGLITENLVLATRMLEAAWKIGVERFLLLSSSTVYPAFDHAVREEEAWSGPPHVSYAGYGWARRCVERMAEFVAMKSKVKMAIVRPAAVYGRWDNFNPQTSHVIPALIRRAVAKENPFLVWGSGEEVRDFLHVSDLAKGALLAFEKHAACDPINIASGEAVTIKEVVRMVLKAAHYDGAKLQFDTSKPTNIPFRKVDISKAKQLLGFAPQIKLEEGLRDTVDWYMKNQNHSQSKASRG